MRKKTLSIILDAFIVLLVLTIILLIVMIGKRGAVPLQAQEQQQEDPLVPVVTAENGTVAVATEQPEPTEAEAVVEKVLYATPDTSSTVNVRSGAGTNYDKLGSAGAVIRGGLDNQGKPAAVSMQYGNNLAITVEMQREIRASIERAFLVPLFQSLTQSKQMTATEVEKRELEKTMLLAPMCERIFAEWLAGNVERELQILSRYGALDGVPDALMRAGSIAIEFENPVVHAQKGETVNGLYKMFDTALSISQVNPAILDVLDMENAMRQIADYLGVGTNVVRTADDVNNLRFQALLTAEHQADEAKQGEADV